MANALATKNDSDLSTTEQKAPSQALRSDLLAPRLLLMQGLSDLVAEGKARQGDIVKSLTGEKVGDMKTPIEFIPLAMQNAWMISEKLNGKYEYRKQIPRKAVVSNADAAAERERDETDKQADDSAWDFKYLGNEWKRTKIINVYALLPGDIKAFQEEITKALDSGEMPDLDKALLPVMISFRSTSFTAGRKVATHFAKCAEMAQYGAKPYGYALTLGCALQENDKGKFFVYDVSGSRRLTKEEFSEAAKLVGDVESGNVKVHDVSDEPAAMTTPDGDTPQF